MVQGNGECRGAVQGGVLFKEGAEFGVSPSGTVWAAGSWWMRLAAKGSGAASVSMADHRGMDVERLV